MDALIAWCLLASVTTWLLVELGRMWWLVLVER